MCDDNINVQDIQEMSTYYISKNFFSGAYTGKIIGGSTTECTVENSTDYGTVEIYK